MMIHDDFYTWNLGVDCLQIALLLTRVECDLLNVLWCNGRCVCRLLIRRLTFNGAFGMTLHRHRLQYRKFTIPRKHWPSLNAQFRTSVHENVWVEHRRHTQYSTKNTKNTKWRNMGASTCSKRARQPIRALPESPKSHFLRSPNALRTIIAPFSPKRRRKNVFTLVLRKAHYDAPRSPEFQLLFEPCSAESLRPALPPSAQIEFI